MSPTTTGANTICPGVSDIIGVTNSNGVSPYTYNWSNGLGTNTSYNVMPTVTTTYTVTATDKCGQTATNDVVVTVANNLTVALSPLSPTICPSASATLTASGGATNYTWAPSIGLSSTTGSSVTASPATTQLYTVTGTSGGCSGTDTITVSVVNNLAVGISPVNPTICPTASVTLTALGTATNYAWSPAAGLSSTTGSSVTASPATNQLYTVTATSGGCSGTDTITVNVVNHLTVTVSPNTSICPGGSTTLTASGATNYSWTGTNLSSNSGATVIASPAANITYTVTGTSGGCTGTASVTVDINPSPTVNVVASQNPICSGTPTTLTSSGASTYLWSGGLGTLNPITVTPAGTTTYDVTGTDANGCTNTSAITITVHPNPILNVTATANAICIGSSTTLTAAGASTYSWSGGLGTTNPLTVTPIATTTYTVTGTDANGCTNTSGITITVDPFPNAQITPKQAACGLSNGSATATGGTSYLWNNGQATATISGLAPNTYSVTVTSAAGCSSSASTTIVNMPGPTITATSTNENCGHANGTASSTPTGGTTPLTYLWSNAATTQNITNLIAGTYTVTVTDANTCTATASVTLTNIPGPSLQIMSFVNETCTYRNGSATVQAVNGVPPYSYVWSNGNTSATATNLSSGTYSCTVTDSNHCTANNTITLTNTPGPTLAITGMDSANCGVSNGSSTLSVTGGTQPYTYNWNSSPGQTTQNLLNVPAGLYIVIVTDGNNCTASVSVDVAQKPGPTATASSTNEICNKSNGTATADATGGMGNYTYLWNTGAITEIDTGLTQGNYTVTVSDGGCTALATVQVGETPGPTAAFMPQPQILTILYGPVFFIDNSTDNSTAIIDWQWNFGDNTGFGYIPDPTHLYSDTGTYLVTLIVTDKNGCKDTTSDTVKVKDIFTFYIPNAFTPNNGMLNNYFYPQGINVDPTSFDMAIYDRWGNQMFHTTEWMANRSAGWNGTKNNSGAFSDAVTDVYVYRIQLKEKNGTRHEYIGNITVLP
jgi:gliding motility-associated-like protein